MPTMRPMPRSRLPAAKACRTNSKPVSVFSRSARDGSAMVQPRCRMVQDIGVPPVTGTSAPVM